MNMYVIIKNSVVLHLLRVFQALEASLKSQVESKLRLKARLKGQVESKLNLEASQRHQVALGVRLGGPSLVQETLWCGPRGAKLSPRSAQEAPS